MTGYVGNKDFSNVIHFLVNRLPLSDRYFSLFFGGGGLEQSIYTRAAFFVGAEKDNRLHTKTSSAAVKYSDYRELLSTEEITENSFVFADPPYIFSARTASRKYYKHEFSMRDHIEFLETISQIKARVMITHPKHDLYSEYLAGWKVEDLEYMTRAGKFKDAVWMNYNPEELELLNYDCLGVDFIDRQRIKRQRKNIIDKFKRLEPHVLNAILREMKKEQII